MPNTKPTQALAACSAALDTSGTAAVQIFPAGQFSIPRRPLQGDGGYRLDAAAAAALIAKIAALKTDILIDYEHQTLLGDKNGKPNPAAGWLSRDPSAWEWRDGEGLFHLRPQWTAAAAAAIRNDEYRYLSAVFPFDPTTLCPTNIYHVALTNTPAIDGMAPVMAALSARFDADMTPPHLTPENPVDEKLNQKLAGLLGLPLAATSVQIEAALDALPVVSGGLSAHLAALSAAKPDPAQFVPLAQFESLKTDFAALKTAHDERLVADLVDPALSDGRLLPAQEQWARDLGKSNLAALKGYLDTAKPLAALSATQTGNKPPVGGEDVTGEAPLEDVCKAEWKKSAALRAEFADDVDSYIAYTKAAKNGQVRLYSKREDS